VIRAVGQGISDSGYTDMYYVYVLKSINFGKFYVGFTSNVNKRLEEHNSGKTKSNKAYAPFAIVYTETFETREEARKREKYFKTGGGRRFLSKIGVK
jgi:putative endonuclease